MIVSKIPYIIIDDYPSFLVSSLEFVLKNFSQWKQHDFSNRNSSPSFEYTIERLSSERDFDCVWRSHRAFVYIFVMIQGERIIDINDISHLTIDQDYHAKKDQILYKGSAQSRIRLQKENIVILFPEEAYRFHYIPNTRVTYCMIKVPLSNL